MCTVCTCVHLLLQLLFILFFLLARLIVCLFLRAVCYIASLVLSVHPAVGSSLAKFEPGVIWNIQGL